MIDRRSPLAAFVVAGVAAGTAAAAWLVGVVEAREVAGACSDRYAILAELSLCRAPAIYGALSWLLFTGAIASAWVGGVRLARNAGLDERSGNLQRQAGNQPATFAREQF
jgi:hypothetical protein